MASFVSTSIPLFVSFEVGAIDTLAWLGFLATARPWARIAMVRIVPVIYLAVEVAASMKPRAGANECIPDKPFWTVVAGRSTVVRSHIIVTIGAYRGRPYFNADLGFRFGGDCREAATSNNCCQKKCKSSHKVHLIISVCVSSNMQS